MPKKRKPIRKHTTSDPRKLGGSIIGPGGPHDIGGVIIDTRNAIILEKTMVSTLDNDSDGRSVIAMFLSGRINRTQDQAEVLYLFGTDGLAAIVTELLALTGRATGIDPTAILSDILERISKLREDGNLT